jgi:hypothetical protein
LTAVELSAVVSVGGVKVAVVPAGRPDAEKLMEFANPLLRAVVTVYVAA